MAWISVVAARPRFRQQVGEQREARQKSGVTAYSVSNAVWAWIGGDEEAIRDEERILTQPTHLTPKMIARPRDALLITLAAAQLVRRAMGEDVDQELKRLAAIKGYTATASLIVQGALERIVSGRALPIRAQASGLGDVGYPQSETDFKKLAAYDVPTAASLALVPEEALWGRLFGTVVPLAYESLQATGRSPDLPTLRALLRAGSDVRHRDVLYERTAEPSTGVWREEPSQVPGFDAVEITNDALIVHHYMGVRWHAPMLLDEELDAFHFLAHVDAGWAIVKDSADPATWARLTHARAELRTIHRVSIDPENAMEDPASTARARDKYGVEIEVVGFLAA